MANNFDVTSANVQAIMIIEDLVVAGFALENFATDAALSGENVEQTETRKGVDGKMVAGVIKNVYPVTITLEASSPSLTYLEMLRTAMQVNNKPYTVTLTVFTPATKRVTTFTKGVLRSCPAMPSVNRTLQPTTWQFDFESCTTSQLTA